MPRESHHKVDIALRKLNTAIDLFFAGTDPFSVITLAGAAEELLGSQLPPLGHTPSLQNTSEIEARLSALMDDPPASVKAIRDRANRVRNSIKHHDPKTDDPFVTADFRQEAIDMLARAMDNAMMLGARWSSQMIRYNDWFMESEVGH